MLTDSDTAWGVQYAADFFNRGLEKSIGQFDVTHDFKFAAVYDLPFGKGQAVADQRSRRLGPGQLARFEHQYLRQRHAGR